MKAARILFCFSLVTSTFSEDGCHGQPVESGINQISFFPVGSALTAPIRGGPAFWEVFWGAIDFAGDCGEQQRRVEKPAEGDATLGDSAFS